MALKKSLDCSLSLVFFALVFSFFIILGFGSAAPVPPDSIGIISNETSVTPSAVSINISGGRIATINLTTNTQNTRWKAFVGNVTGSFSLDDASGSTIYDWSLTTISGEIYATTNSSTITWSTVNCSNVTTLEFENTKMSHSNIADNITRTFNRGINGTHDQFFVGALAIAQNTCPTLNTYVGNSTQDSSFEEIALYESAGNNIVYASIMEPEVEGFDGNSYDFQMIVPENGALGFTSSTAYYLYVELT